MTENSAKGGAFVAGGSLGGAWVSSAVGGMGLTGAFGGVGIGMAPVMGAGAVAGAAAFGALRGLQERDAVAFGAIGLGAVGGVGVSASIGGMGFAVGGSAFGIGMGAMAATGGVVGLGIYGLAKMLDSSKTKESPGEVFARMEEKISAKEAYVEALLELELLALDSILAEEVWKQKLAAREVEEELNTLKNPIPEKTTAFFNFSAANFPQYPFIPFPKPRATKTAVISVNAQAPETWKCIKTLQGHTGAVNSVAISPDSRTLVSGSDDKTVLLWNLKTGQQLYSFWGQDKEVSSVAISADGGTVASGSFDQKITTWNLKAKVLLRTFLYLNSSSSHSGFVYALAFSPNGTILASGGADKVIKLWNGATGKHLYTFNGHSDAVLSVAIAPNSTTLASGSSDRTIRLWDLNTRQELHILTGHHNWVTAVAIHPEGKILVSGSTDSTVKVWNIQTGELLQTLTGHSAGVFSVAISVNGQILASASHKEVKLWNLQTGELLETLSGCTPVAFSRDNQTLVTGGKAGSIKIWHRSDGASESTWETVPTGEWWEVLGVDQNANAEEVKQAYRRLGRQYHPDVNSSAQAKAIMQAINQAYARFQQ